MLTVVEELILPLNDEDGMLLPLRKLDVTFREDASRIRRGNAPRNLGVIRHVAVNLLGRERAVRLVLDHQGEQDSQWSAILSVSSKIGSISETLRK